MKKNWVLRLGLLAMVLTLVTMPMVSSTYAKYTSSVTGSDTARVAKFAFNIKDGEETIGSQGSLTGTYDIFTYTDDGVYNNGVNTQKIIAPGTTGSIPITVENRSEVDVAVTFVLTETNAGGIPVYYTVGAATQRYSAVLTGTYGTGTYESLSDLATAMAGTTLQATNGTTPTTVTYTLHWTWAFDTAGTNQTDALDTALGMAATATVALQIATTVTQIN